MPKAPETNPDVLRQRKERKRARGVVNTANYRKRINEKVESLMGQALDVLSDDVVDPDSLQSPAQSSAATRTARSILKRTLRRYGLTLDKAARRLLEGLDSEKLRLLGEEVRSLPDTGNRLRSTDMLLKLLERSGDLVGAQETQAPQEITVNVLMLNQGDTVSVPLIAPRPILDSPATPPRPTRNVVPGSAAYEAKLKREAPYELPGALPEAAETGSK
jgi:hypothetical protein